jgi:hypothetical protein
MYKSHHSLTTYSTGGLLRGRCVGWFVKLPVLPRSLPSLPRSLFLLAPSLACYRGLHTVALCKSVASSRRHVPAVEGKTPPTSSPHLRWAQLWRFIKSDLILLTIAVAVSHINYTCVCVLPGAHPPFPPSLSCAPGAANIRRHTCTCACICLSLFPVSTLRLSLSR